VIRRTLSFKFVVSSSIHYYFDVVIIVKIGLDLNNKKQRKLTNDLRRVENSQESAAADQQSTKSNTSL
jgi:hypothetical protein